MNIPSYLTPLMIIGNASIIVAALFGLHSSLKRAAWSDERRRRIVLGASAILAGWFALAAGMAYFGFFQGAANRVPTVELGLLLPLVIGLVWLWKSKTAANLLDSVPQRWLIGLQFYRVIGATFVMLWGAHLLPDAFAVPAGFGDIAIGILAPLVALAYTRALKLSVTAARVWNALGLLDLLIAVTCGFLTSPSPIQLFSLDAPNLLISAFPLVLVPVFAVPFSVLLHVASLLKLARTAPTRAAGRSTLSGDAISTLAGSSHRRAA